MTTEELLQPRIKCIGINGEHYPNSPFKVDEVLFIHINKPYYGDNVVMANKEYDGFSSNWIDLSKAEKYPHLFKRLDWWEERKVEDIEPEKWATIKNYEGLYDISSYGRVKSLSRVTTRKHKGIKKYEFIRKGKILKNQVKSDGYLKVELSKNNITQILYVHRLVAEAFIPNPEKKPNVNHIKSFTWFNWIGNLEWCTQSENLIHAVNTNNYCNKIKTRKKPLFHARSKEHREFLANQSLNQITNLALKMNDKKRI